MLGVQCQAGPLNWCSLPLIGGSLFTKQLVLLPFNLPFTNKIEVGFHIKLSKPIIQTWLTLNVNWLRIKLFQLVGGQQKRGSNKLCFKFVLKFTEFSGLSSKDIQKLTKCVHTHQCATHFDSSTTPQADQNVCLPIRIILSDIVQPIVSQSSE